MSARPDASASANDTREVKMSRNERDWLEYMVEFFHNGLQHDGAHYGWRVSYHGDDYLTEGGKDNMVRRATQLVRRFDKARQRTGARR